MTRVNEPIHPVIPRELAGLVKAHGATAQVLESVIELDGEEAEQVSQTLYLPNAPLPEAMFKRIAGHQSQYAAALKLLALQYRRALEVGLSKSKRELKGQVHELYSSRQAHKNMGAALRARGLDIPREARFQGVADSEYPYPNGKYDISGDIQ